MNVFVCTWGKGLEESFHDQAWLPATPPQCVCVRERVWGHWWTLANLPERRGSELYRHRRRRTKRKKEMLCGFMFVPIVLITSAMPTDFYWFSFHRSLSLAFSIHTHTHIHTHTRELGSCKVGRRATWYSIRILQRGRLWSTTKKWCRRKMGWERDEDKSKAIRTKCVCLVLIYTVGWNPIPLLILKADTKKYSTCLCSAKVRSGVGKQMFIWFISHSDPF